LDGSTVKSSPVCRNRPEMDKASDARNQRLLEQRDVLVPRVSVMIAGAKERMNNTRRMIAQSKELLGKAHQALETSKLIRRPVRRIADADALSG